MQFRLSFGFLMLEIHFKLMMPYLRASLAVGLERGMGSGARWI